MELEGQSGHFEYGNEQEVIVEEAFDSDYPVQTVEAEYNNNYDE